MDSALLVLVPWSCAAMLFLAILLQVRALSRSRHPAMVSAQAEWASQAEEILDGRPPTRDLLTAMADHAPGLLAAPGVDDEYWTSPVAVERLGSGGLPAPLLEAVRQTVNAWNSFAELVDEDLVRPSQFFSKREDLHRAALVEISLIAPVIWHRSIIGGRGRWGYRPLQLLSVARSLRGTAFGTEIVGAVVETAVVDGVETRVRFAGPLGRSGQIRGVVAATFRRRTITPRTKARQERTLSEMRAELPWIAPTGPASRW